MENEISDDGELSFDGKFSILNIHYESQSKLNDDSICSNRSVNCPSAHNISSTGTQILRRVHIYFA